MKIYELFDSDPRTRGLANNGQARIADSRDNKATEELRAELETFVCEGQFADAIQRILDRYLGNLDNPRQDSAWVSGFFGSGKSHLLKMITHLCLNTSFTDGATARSLVRGGLPDEVEAVLRELDTQVKRNGKNLFAAAGTLLGGTDHVRQTVLSTVLNAGGWPAQYPQAMFCFWLREQGHLDAVRNAVESAGKDWLKELNDLYVSPVIASALIEADPNFAADVKSARQVLIQQYSQLSTDITTQQFIEATRKALSPDSDLPLTIIVLDEVQQYINEATDRASVITEVAEALQTQFDSRVMLVGAGQSALSAGTPALMWLRDRFRITIELTDADVEAVTRKVVLRKKASVEPQIEQMFERHSGEVARHLRGTKVGQRPEDRRDQTSDYPLLSTRRRFWEACFQTADAAGTHSQLRSQLRILHDSLQNIADRDLGAAIPASDLFKALAPLLVNTGVLLNQINTSIQKLDDGTDDGILRRDLCGLAFLIGKLPHEEGVDLGVRANATMLADLMIDNITADSGSYRKRVDDALEALADEGVLMKVDDEFRLQTTEGAEWDRAFRQNQGALRQNEVEISTRRDHLFGEAIQRTLADIKLIHGDAKLRRTLSLYAGNEPPRSDGDQIVVWLRDGWGTALKDVEAEARRLGSEDPTLHVHLPKKSADVLKNRIIDAEAARLVLDHYGVPSTPEGNEARESMESRRRRAESAQDEMLRDLVHAAKVLQGGGSEVFGDNLRAKIETGADASLARLFPRFQQGDHRAWEAAVKRAKDGSDQPFKVVGWDNATEDHPVAKEVLSLVNSANRGTEIQKTLKATPFGWPQDAIDAALIALHRSGHLRATRNGQPINVGKLDQAGVKAAEFRLEKVRLTTNDKITLRGLFDKAGVTVRSGEEEIRAMDFLERAIALASNAGGDAPLPPAPETTMIDDLNRLTGTDQLGAILEKREEIESRIQEWKSLGDRAIERRNKWEMAVKLRHHATGLPVLDKVGPELDAIIDQRSLLGDTDHVTPLVVTLGTALREALNTLHGDLGAAVEEAHKSIATDTTWTKLDAEVQEEIRSTVGLISPTPLSVDDDKQLESTLQAQSLSAMRTAIDAVPQRVSLALTEAAKRIDPGRGEKPVTTVSIRRGTLPDEAAVRAWLDEHETKLADAIAKGPVIIN